MAKRSQGACCGCIFAIIGVLIVVALLLGFVLSKIYTIEQVGLADKPGILANFDEKYAKEETFRSLGMENWKLWDLFMWIIKSGDYTPKSSSPAKIF